eukprot:3013009-Rhodomonas_salina.1
MHGGVLFCKHPPQGTVPTPLPCHRSSSPPRHHSTHIHAPPHIAASPEQHIHAPAHQLLQRHRSFKTAPGRRIKRKSWYLRHPRWYLIRIGLYQRRLVAPHAGSVPHMAQREHIRVG